LAPLYNPPQLSLRGSSLYRYSGRRGDRINISQLPVNLTAPLRYIGRTCALGLEGPYRAGRLRLPPSCRPPLRAPPFSPRRARSWSSFCEITDSQKRTTALRDFSSLIQASIIAGNERSRPTTATRARRSSVHAGHSSNVCCAVSSGAPQWWHSAVRSRPIQRRNSPRHPCPVRICAVRNGIPPPPRPIHSARRGWIAATTRAVLGLASCVSLANHSDHSSIICCRAWSFTSLMALGGTWLLCASRSSRTRQYTLAYLGQELQRGNSR